MSGLGSGRFGPAVADFDRRADELLELLRGHPALDRLMTAATHAGEFSLVWHACSLCRGAFRRRPDQIMATAVGIGAESLIVNQVLKRAFRRERPTVAGDERFAIRRPLTSSFPSGHASAAAFAVIVLVGWDGRRWAPVWGTLAATVAVSRAYVRIHHASDVVAGLLVGGALGQIARRVFARLGLD